jgi:hypothetical protein
MKVTLQTADGKAFHQGVIPAHKAPEVIVWGSRAFILDSMLNTGSAAYRETAVHFLVPQR